MKDQGEKEIKALEVSNLGKSQNVKLTKGFSPKHTRINEIKN